MQCTKLLMSALVLANTAWAANSDQNSGPTPNHSNSPRRVIGAVFASDGQPMQASIDFYRSVIKSLSTSPTWDALPLNTIRKGLAGDPDGSKMGGIPTIDRETFRQRLPRRSTKGGKTKVIPGTAVPELQRFLDNIRSPAVIVVDCARKDKALLRACALYYYDRVASRVVASSVKTFVSGANDASMWAQPMLRSLEDGIASAQREKDQAVIEELVARNEDEETKEIYGVIGLFGKGDRARVNNGWSQTISGGGLQLGFLKENIGAVAEAGYLSWSGSSANVDHATRINYGLSMMFRANALDALLWFFEIGGGKESTQIVGASSDDKLNVDGAYLQVSPGIGLELSEFFTLNLGIGWRWFFENSVSRSGVLKDSSLDDTHGPSLALRAMILL